MREILFRGKNKYIGWVYGQLAYDIDGDAYIIQEVEIDTSYGLEENMLFATIWYRVQKETIGQFTGLYDKNGKEIYEGDIAINNDAEVIGKIIYNKDEAGFYYAILLEDNKFDEENIIDYIDDLKVIGNIYDNKNLLEEK